MIKTNHVFLLCCLVLVITHFFYYPKWKMSHTEATISWDVSGYYWYLPAVFIYGDLKQLEWQESIHETYRPASSMYQSFPHPSGHPVMKYSIGQSISYLPFFAMGHLFSYIGPWYPDGFSTPYQFFISLGSLLFAMIGLWYSMKILRRFFDQSSVAISLLLLVIGTNYLNYSAIDGAMTHNYLFTIYSLLIWATIKFYERMSWKGALAIGALVGLAALTRPSEIIIAGIPLLWNIDSLQAINDRIKVILKQWKYYLGASFLVIMIGLIQLIYWKYVTGEWIVYSYQDQGFSWLKPHLKDGLFSFKKGWLVYTPMMIFALLGFIPLYRNKRKLFWPLILLSMSIVYLTFAWDIWWYGGSLGQRAMVQSYAIFMIPLAASVQWTLRDGRRFLWPISLTWGVFCYFNIWLTHQAHLGGLLDPENMTKAYFWKVLGSYDQPIETKKLLDNNEESRGIRTDLVKLFSTNFEEAKGVHCNDHPIYGIRSLCLDATNQSHSIEIQTPNNQFEWLRASIHILSNQKEWDVWRMAQIKLRFFQQDRLLKEKYIRLHRLIEERVIKEVYIEAKCPKEEFDHIEVMFWNAGGDKTIYIDDLLVEGFNTT